MPGKRNEATHVVANEPQETAPPVVNAHSETANYLQYISKHLADRADLVDELVAALEKPTAILGKLVKDIPRNEMTMTRVHLGRIWTRPLIPYRNNDGGNMFGDIQINVSTPEKYLGRKKTNAYQTQPKIVKELPDPWKWDKVSFGNVPAEEREDVDRLLNVGWLEKVSEDGQTGTYVLRVVTKTGAEGESNDQD